MSSEYKSNLIHHLALFSMCFLFSRRKSDNNITIDTVCHNPAQKLQGLALEDYNNSKCEMKEIKGMGSEFFICSCSEDECNEHVFFNPGESVTSGKDARFHNLQYRRSLVLLVQHFETRGGVWKAPLVSVCCMSAAGYLRSTVNELMFVQLPLQVTKSTSRQKGKKKNALSDILFMLS